MNCRNADAKVRHPIYSVAVACVLILGCGFGEEVNEYEQLKLSMKEAAETLEAKGAKVIGESKSIGKSQRISLEGMTIDDEVVASIQSLIKITELDFSGSTITDEQLAEIATQDYLGWLMKLDLSDTQVTDVGLQALSDLPMLHDINVKGTKTTAAGIQQFESQRPKHPFGQKLKITK